MKLISLLSYLQSYDSHIYYLVNHTHVIKIVFCKYAGKYYQICEQVQMHWQCTCSRMVQKYNCLLFLETSSITKQLTAIENSGISTFSHERVKQQSNNIFAVPQVFGFENRGTEAFPGFTSKGVFLTPNQINL